MPWSYAVQFLGVLPPGDSLPLCFKISSDVPGNTGDNLRWDGVLSAPGIQLSITLTGQSVSEGTDPDFGPFRDCRFIWRFVESISGSIGDADDVARVFRGDTDIVSSAIVWTGTAFFTRAAARCLAWDAAVEARAECRA